MSTPTPELPALDPDYAASLRDGFTESLDDFDRRMAATEQQTNTAQGDPS
ncbi:hypothetical protein [Streptomyces sp. NPDC046821]